MVWVYDHYKDFNSFSPGVVFVRQNLTTPYFFHTRRVRYLALYGWENDNLAYLFVCVR